MGKSKFTLDAPDDEDAKAPAADGERTVVYLGNRDAIEVLTDDDGTTERRALPEGKRCTTIVLAPDLPLMDAAYDITHSSRGVWNAHSDADAPAWVASTDPALASLLASHWGIELRDPEPATDQPTTDDDGEG